MKDKSSWPTQSSIILINERHWKVVFGTGVIEIAKVRTCTR
jgi:hypothetical protein